MTASRSAGLDFSPKSVSGVSTIHQTQAEVLAALKVTKPSNDAQMSLL